MIKIIPGINSVNEVQAFMASSIAPRPIALVSTISEDGIPNLSPFSFYNSFGTNPPILAFSPSLRQRDSSIKHTLKNLQKIPELVINTVSYDMVQQISLASTEYGENVNEFIKSGLTQVGSEKIRPFRVKESKLQFECKVLNIIETGKMGGAGNLVICEILLIHVNQDCLNEKGRIDHNIIDLVGRMGENFYCRASGDAIFEVKKPIDTLGIGIDSLPDHIRFSKILTGNDLGKLGNLENLPSQQKLAEFKSSDIYRKFLQNLDDSIEAKQLFAQKLIEENLVYEALMLLLLDY